MTGVAVGVSPGFGRSVGRYSPQASGADSLSEQAGFEPAVPPLKNPRSDARRGFPSSIALALPPSEFDTPGSGASGTDGSRTLPWRGLDSNHRFRETAAKCSTISLKFPTSYVKSLTARNHRPYCRRSCDQNALLARSEFDVACVISIFDPAVCVPAAEPVPRGPAVEGITPLPG